MSAIVHFVGGAGSAVTALAESLRAASCSIARDETEMAESNSGQADKAQACRPATPLVGLSQTAAAAIAAAAAFAEAHAAEGEDRLVVNIWHVPASTDWEASRDAAILAAFTRHAAQDWAGRRVRVNGVTLALAPDGGRMAEDDIAATIQALWRWRSMTGQVIQLGG